MSSFVKHKLKKSEAKRAERNMPQPKAKAAVVEKTKAVSKQPKLKS